MYIYICDRCSFIYVLSFCDTFKSMISFYLYVKNYLYMKYIRNIY